MQLPFIYYKQRTVAFIAAVFTTAYLNEPDKIPYTCLIPHSYYCDLATDRSKNYVTPNGQVGDPTFGPATIVPGFLLSNVGIGFGLQFRFRLDLRLGLVLGIILGPGLVQHT